MHGSEESERASSVHEDAKEKHYALDVHLLQPFDEDAEPAAIVMTLCHMIL